MNESETTIKFRKLGLLALGASLAIAATGCFENNNLSKYVSSASSTSGVTSTSSGTQLTISNVVFTQTGSTYSTGITFNTTNGNISTYCNTSSAACSCNFSWTQVNTTSGSSVSIGRSVQTTATGVQSGQLACPAPDVFSTITTGTILNVTVSPGSGNGSAFSTNTYNYTVGATTTSSDFQDSQGDSFQDILRYTCYDETMKGMNIASALQTATNSSTGAAAGTTVQYPMASQFCVETAASASSGASASSQCTGQLSSPDYSGQSYYYNLYIRDSESGDINYTNSKYTCPTVKQALGNNGTVGTENKAYPLDRTFALSMGPTATFNVGVESYTALSNGGSDPVTAPSTCFSSSTSGSGSSSSSSSIVNSCLGYAASPNPDGTCSSIKDSNGKLHLMYRLRRYVALYPRMFDSDGTPLQQIQPEDVIYVLDRPVVSSNPLVPYTMAGPKPCPFAYFDRNGLATGTSNSSFGAQLPATVADYTNAAPAGLGLPGVPGYLATGNSSWTGKNIDGVQLPNKDSANSCSAVIGVLGSGDTIMSFATVNSLNPQYKSIYIRPVTAWSPHYVEDTSFQACAPQPSTLQDPPLHFARDAGSGNVGWCAEVYPSQNPYITSLDSKFPGSSNYIGDVTPYTSHVAKNSASATCTADVPSLPSTYPAAGAAEHTITSLTYPGATSSINSAQTCDRTVTSTTVNWGKFPLLAPPQDVENAITGDISNYGCLITWDNNGGKSGKASPSTGCCTLANVNVGTGTGSGTASTAHLEPDVQCQTPTY